MSISIIGGTGDLGRSLALRLAYSGFTVCIGSRSRKKAEDLASSINEKAYSGKVIGLDNVNAAKEGRIIILSIPNKARADIISNIADEVDNKIVLDVTVPLSHKGGVEYCPPLAGSNAEETQQLLGNRARVIAGLHTISAVVLGQTSLEIEGDVLIVGDEQEAKEEMIAILKKMNMRSFDAGPLPNARIIERLTPMIIGLNKRYKKRNIGIRLTGI
jgi:NADPH-dependent F420 reductase